MQNREPLLPIFWAARIIAPELSVYSARWRIVCLNFDQIARQIDAAGKTNQGFGLIPLQ
jgi:hypothetical protein